MSDTTKTAENVIHRRRADDWKKPDTPQSSFTEHDDGSVTLSRERKMVCLESAWELEALANILPGLVPNVMEAEGAHYAVRGIADRINRLSCVLMSGLFDEGVTVKSLERKVFVVREAA